MGFRHEAIKFLNICRNKSIYLTIVDGGISDVIALMLDNVMYLNHYDGLKIIANELAFTTRGFLRRYDVKVNAVAKGLTINEQMIGNRKNIILIGDRLEDTNMVANVDYENIIQIGFLNTPKNYEVEVKIGRAHV